MGRGGSLSSLLPYPIHPFLTECNNLTGREEKKKGEEKGRCSYLKQGKDGRFFFMLGGGGKGMGRGGGGRKKMS